jgi:hypothetical protein
VKKSVLFFIALFFAFNFFNSNLKAEVKSIVYLKNGKKITGSVKPGKNPDSLYVLVEGDFLATYPKSAIDRIESMRTFGAIGLGVGLPYGVFGVNLEIEPFKYFDITGGIGTTFFGPTAWNVGVIGYFNDQDAFIRPRITLLYGVNKMLGLKNGYYSSSYDDWESFTGFCLGGGISMMLSEQHAFNYEIYIILSSGFDDRKKEIEQQGGYIEDDPMPIKFSVGYKFCF